MTADFVLDKVENPHPVMLTGALAARQAARENGGRAAAFWAGYMAAMVDATGCDAEDLEAWMDRA